MNAAKRHLCSSEDRESAISEPIWQESDALKNRIEQSSLAWEYSLHFLKSHIKAEDYAFKSW